MEKNVTIKQNEEQPVATEILAEAIVTVSRAMKKVLAGPLADNALILLIQDAAGGRNRISQDDVRLVLRNAARLEELFVRQPKKKR